MSTSLLIYLYIVIGNIVGTTMLIVVIGGTCLAAAFIITGLDSNFGKDGGDDPDDDSRIFFKICRFGKRSLIFCAPFIVLATLYPNKEDLALIIGGSALVSVAQTEEAQKLPENVLKAANAFLEGVYEDQE